MKNSFLILFLGLAILFALSVSYDGQTSRPVNQLPAAESERLEMLKQKTGYCWDFKEVQYSEPDIYRSDCKHYEYQGRTTYFIGSYTNVLENIVSEVYLDPGDGKLILLRWHMVDQNAEFIDGVTFADKLPTNNTCKP